MIRYKEQAGIVCLLFTAYLVAGTDISCISPQNVVKGESASLTCIYNQNLQTEKQDFYIFRHHSGKDTVIVAICAWEDSSLTCDFQPGYNASVHGYNVTLSISSVGAEHAGNYTCTKLPPEDGDKTEPCVLSVKGEVKHSTPKVNCFAPAHLSGDHRVSATCIFPDSLNADTVSLQRHDTAPSSKPVELVRCDRGESCKVKEDGCPIETEHNKADGFRIITAKVNKAGHYICRATNDAGQEEICVMELKKGADKLDGWDESLKALSAPLYGILVVLISVLVIVGVVVALHVRRLRRRKNPTRNSLAESVPLSRTNNNG